MSTNTHIRVYRDQTLLCKHALVLGSLGLIPLLVVIYGNWVVSTASFDDGILFAGFTALIVWGLFRLVGDVSARLGRLIYVAFVFGIVIGGHYVFYRNVADVSMTSSFVAHLRLQTHEGLWSREGSRSFKKDVLRRGIWLWIGWSLQLVFVAAGVFVGMTVGYGQATDALTKRRIADARGFGRQTQKALRHLLGTDDLDGLRRINDLLLMAELLRTGHSLDEAQLAPYVTITSTVNQRRYGQRAGAPTDPIDRDALLLYAAEQLQQIRSGLRAYDAKRLIVYAYKHIHQGFTEYYLRPEPRFDGTGFDDVPLDDVSATTFMPLLRQWEIESPRLYDDWTDASVAPALRDYGVRLYPAVLAFLCHPETYSRVRDSTFTGMGLFEFIGQWPQTQAEPLFRRAFEIGWNDCARWLPAETWAQSLVAEFADSPYGPPRLPQH